MLKSVHLCSFPDLSSFIEDKDLIIKMDKVMDICNSVLSLRNEFALRVRLPLKKLTIYSKNASEISDFSDIMIDELNVKQIVFSDDFSTVAKEKISINLKLCGTKFGSQLKDLVSAANAGNYVRLGDGVVVGGKFNLSADEFSLKLEPIDSSRIRLCGAETAIELDISKDEALEREGMVRDLVRFVQQDRGEAGFSVVQKISLQLITNSESIRSSLADSDLFRYFIENTGVRADDFCISSVENSPKNVNCFVHEMIDGSVISVIFSQ